MSELKCPFCQQELHHYEPLGLYMCKTCFADCRLGMQDFGTKGLWQELIRTRKALAFAKSKLNGIHRLYSNAFYTREDWLQVCMEMVDKANTALDKITALEPKD